MKLEAPESVIAPNLRSGRFTASDKLIASLMAPPGYAEQKDVIMTLRSGPAKDRLRIKIDSALNRAFNEWNRVFSNANCIATLLDRLTHHADFTVLEGSSYRVRNGEQESQKRRRQP